MANPGNSSDLEQLLTHADWLHKLARSLILDDADAEDLVQETWIQAFRNPPRKLDSELAVKSWLGRVARNLAKNKHRHRARLRLREHKASERESRFSEPAIRRLEESELLLKLSIEVSNLPSPYRDVLILHYWESLDVQEIAQKLKIDSRNVRKRIERGLERIRMRLESAYGKDWRSLCIAKLILKPTRTSALFSAAVCSLLLSWKWFPPILLVLAAILAAQWMDSSAKNSESSIPLETVTRSGGSAIDATDLEEIGGRVMLSGESTEQTGAMLPFRIVERVWSHPMRTFAPILVQNGIVVIPSNPENPREYSGFDVQSGERLWKKETAPTYEPAYACALGNRVFLPQSRVGFGDAEKIECTVECRNLKSGELIWIWDSEIPGSIFGLQLSPEIESAKLSKPARIVFTLIGLKRQGYRLVTIDPFAETASKALIAMSLPRDDQNNASRGLCFDDEMVYEHRRQVESHDGITSNRFWINKYDEGTLEWIDSAPLGTQASESDSLDSSSQPVIDDGFLYLFDISRELVCLELEEFLFSWSIPTGFVSSRPKITPMSQALLLSSHRDPTIRAFSKKQAALVWEWSHPDGALPTLSTQELDDGSVCLSFQNGEIRVVTELHDGEIRISKSIHREPLLSDFLLVDGFLVIATKENQFVCYRVETIR